MWTAEVPLVRTRVFGTIARKRTFPDATLIEIRYAPRTLLPLHAHESCLFLLTLQGSFEETVGRRSRICRPRRLVYRPAGEPHSQQFAESGATCLAIELPGMRDAALEGTDDRLELGGAPTLLALRLHDEFCRPSNDTPLVVEETVAALTGASRRPEDGQPERSPRWLKRVLDIIESRFATPIRLRDLAAEADRHPVHVSRCFRRHCGCEVSQFVRRRRVHEACRRIRRGQEPLGAIAASTGFSDQSHMGRAFREVMGRSPGAYRQR
jgi:AraC family transcriptional regulator